MKNDKRILLADDDPAVRKPLVWQFQQIGYKVIHVDNGKKAFEAFLKAERIGTPFDILITDIQMPVLSGLELVGKIREKGFKTRFLAMSGHGTQEVIVALKALGGCVGLVVKPFTPQDLLNRLTNVLPPPVENAKPTNVISPAFPPPASRAESKGEKQIRYETLDSIMAFTAEINSMVENPNLVLPVLPGPALEVRRVIAAPDFNFDQVAQVVSQEPALSARILQVANSSVYAGLERVSNLSQAVSRLGLQEICNIIEAILARRLFTTSLKKLDQMMRDLWVHSVCTAYGNEIVAKAMGLPNSGDYFMMGLLHDIGKLLILHLIQVGERENRWKEEDLTDEIILPFFAMRHNDLGARLMESWDYPLAFQHVARLHDDERNIPYHSEPVVITYFTNLLARKLGFSTMSLGDRSLDNKALISAMNINAETREKIEIDVAEVTNRVRNDVLCATDASEEIG